MNSPRIFPMGHHFLGTKGPYLPISNIHVNVYSCNSIQRVIRLLCRVLRLLLWRSRCRRLARFALPSSGVAIARPLPPSLSSAVAPAPRMAVCRPSCWPLMGSSFIPARGSAADASAASTGLLARFRPSGRCPLGGLRTVALSSSLLSGVTPRETGGHSMGVRGLPG
jgi:hypothetical protein